MQHTGWVIVSKPGNKVKRLEMNREEYRRNIHDEINNGRRAGALEK